MFAHGYSLKIDDTTPESAVFYLRVLENYADSIDADDPCVDLETYRAPDLLCLLMVIV